MNLPFPECSYRYDPRFSCKVSCRFCHFFCFVERMCNFYLAMVIENASDVNCHEFYQFLVYKQLCDRVLGFYQLTS